MGPRPFGFPGDRGNCEAYSLSRRRGLDRREGRGIGDADKPSDDPLVATNTETGRETGGGPPPAYGTDHPLVGGLELVSATSRARALSHEAGRPVSELTTVVLSSIGTGGDICMCMREG